MLHQNEIHAFSFFNQLDCTPMKKLTASDRTPMVPVSTLVNPFSSPLLSGLVHSTNPTSSAPLSLSLSSKQPSLSSNRSYLISNPPPLRPKKKQIRQRQPVRSSATLFRTVYRTRTSRPPCHTYILQGFVFKSSRVIHCLSIYLHFSHRYVSILRGGLEARHTHTQHGSFAREAKSGQTDRQRYKYGCREVEICFRGSGGVGWGGMQNGRAFHMVYEISLTE